MDIAWGVEGGGVPASAAQVPLLPPSGRILLCWTGCVNDSFWPTPGVEPCGAVRPLTGAHLAWRAPMSSPRIIASGPVASATSDLRPRTAPRSYPRPLLLAARDSSSAPPPPTRSSLPSPRCACAPSVRATAARAGPCWRWSTSCCKARRRAGRALRDSANSNRSSTTSSSATESKSSISQTGLPLERLSTRFDNNSRNGCRGR